MNHKNHKNLPPRGGLGWGFGVFFLFLCLASLHAQPYRHYAPVNKNADKGACDLLELLYKTVDEGKIISGLHHNQLNMPAYRRDLDRIEQAVPGAVPMVWGGDLAWDASQVVEMSIDHHRKGYIIAITWHAARPFDTGKVNFKQQTQGKFTPKQWKELVTPGSTMHRQWIAQVDSIAGYLETLQDNNVPVLWRPFHEMNGEWFWWGDRRGDKGFTVLWKMLYDRLTNYHHLNNLIWVWNPNNPRKHPHDDAMAYDLYYPGDEYVDVLAADVYHREWFQDTHDQLLELGNEKLIALGEVGELPTSEQLSHYDRYAWFMIWTSFTDDKYNTIDALRDVFGDKRTVNYKDKTLPLRKKAAEWAASLELTDKSKQQRVEDAIFRHLCLITQWYDQHPGSQVPAGINPRTGERLRAIDRQIIADSAQPKEYHEDIMKVLRDELTNDQIEQILDKYTVGKVAFTMKAYREIVPNITPEEDAYCLNALKEARENAIDYKSMKEISEIFGIAKDKCELYFNTHGRNWRQMYSDYVKKIKSKK